VIHSWIWQSSDVMYAVIFIWVINKFELISFCIQSFSFVSLNECWFVLYLVREMYLISGCLFFLMSRTGKWILTEFGICSLKRRFYGEFDFGLYCIKLWPLSSRKPAWNLFYSMTSITDEQLEVLKWLFLLR